jgi:thiol:disulfide interchange protein DsbA
MIKLVSVLLLATLLPLHANAVDLWEEGKHYTVISDKATAKPEVKEFFSFWCPACYRFEPIVKTIKNGLSNDVKFTKVHVNFMKFAGPDVQEAATKAMIIARAMKKETELNGAIFNYIHEQRSTVTGLKDLRSVFVINGVEPDKFDKLAKSFSVKSLFNKNNKEITKFRENLNGVPNFIVNGKYQATFTKDMSKDDIADLIIWLTKQA